MEFLPEEIRQIILIEINKVERKLPNLNFEDFLEAYRLYYTMIFMSFDFNITLSYGKKLLECEIQCNNEEEKIKVNDKKSFIKSTIKSLEFKIEKDKRRILN